VTALTIIRPVPWARTIGDLHFRPTAWSDRVIRMAAPGGMAFLLRRHGAPDLPLWIPGGLAPVPGKPFGLYLHPDRNHSERIRTAESFRRAIGLGAPLRAPPNPHAHRQAAMLCIHDLRSAGASLRDIAGELLDSLPDDWRLSSERSDLRRLADTAAEMVTGGYRRLLGAHPKG
jgi:hypothetical protein